jgi:signal transduction histidine kinase
LISVESPGAPEWTEDRMVLRQALLNLANNAIKFTPVGGRITVRVEESSSGVTIDMSDTGPGIPEALQAQVFERFYRVKRMSASEREGKELGLSIAKWAVEVNGGRLTLEESSSSGSTFRITLPQRQAKTPFVPSSRAG